MKLSNTMIMNETLLPNSKKAFTLAEVLITLSILGVVAALTIPSLVNRQSEMAAIVKLKKAISQFEQVADVYMAENDATSLSGMVKKTANCDQLTEYFKVINTVGSTNFCSFKTADGVEWRIKYDGSQAVAYDSAKPTFGVAMWVDSTGDAGLVNAGTMPTFDSNLKNSSATVYAANEFLKLKNKKDDTAATALASDKWGSQ